MNNTVLSGLILGTVVVAAGAAIAVNSGFNPWQKYATVVAVEPAFESNRVPRQVCGEEAKRAASTAPAQAGAAPAAKPESGTSGAKEGTEDCVVVYDTQSIEAGYDVTYELNGEQKVVRMDHDPGERIPVENGRLVLSRR
jgi:uncharacterized protein YcfJ